jgi:hypothetical protein
MQARFDASLMTAYTVLHCRYFADIAVGVFDSLPQTWAQLSLHRENLSTTLTAKSYLRLGAAFSSIFASSAYCPPCRSIHYRTGIRFNLHRIPFGQFSSMCCFSSNVVPLIVRFPCSFSYSTFENEFTVMVWTRLFNITRNNVKIIHYLTSSCFISSM